MEMVEHEPNQREHERSEEGQDIGKAVTAHGWSNAHCGVPVFPSWRTSREDWKTGLQGNWQTCYAAEQEEPMLQHSQRHYSEDDYFVVEASSGIKHEFYQGEIFALAGASLAHNHLSANVLQVFDS